MVDLPLLWHWGEPLCLRGHQLCPWEFHENAHTRLEAWARGCDGTKTQRKTFETNPIIFICIMAITKGK